MKVSGPAAFGRRIDTLQFMRIFLVVVLYSLSAASAFGGYYIKWGFWEGDVRCSFRGMVDRTAMRPYVYRQLLPLTVNGIEDIVPDRIKNRVIPVLIQAAPDGYTTKLGLHRGDADSPKYAFRYYLLYSLSFFCYFISLFLMRTTCRRIGISAVGAVCAPVIFSLALPVLMEDGGYFYDLSEILFLFSALYCVLGKYKWLIIPLAIPATLNKESFLFFLVCMAVLLIKDRKDYRGIATYLCAVAVSAGTYLLDNRMLKNNPGGVVEHHFLVNLKFYLNPLSLFHHDRTYGLPLFAGYSIVGLAAIAIMFFLGRAVIRGKMGRFTALVAALNIPLLILFCGPGEMRNLSMLYPSFVFAIGAAVDRLVASSRPPQAA